MHRRGMRKKIGTLRTGSTDLGENAIVEKSENEDDLGDEENNHVKNSRRRQRMKNLHIVEDR